MRRNVVSCLLIALGCVLLPLSANADIVWIDVRSPLEYKLDSIEGDKRISDFEIVSEVKKLYPDKTTEIRLYCLGGSRAERAAIALADAGYINVTSAGGIKDARRERGLY